MDYRRANRPSLFTDAYDALPSEIDYQRTNNVVPSFQPDARTMHGRAAAELDVHAGLHACLYPKCGAAFQDVTDLEGHMKVHNFDSLVHQDLGPASTLNGFTWDPIPTDDTVVGYINTKNTFPNVDASMFANPIGPSNTLAAPLNTSSVASVQNPAPVPVAGAATPARHACTDPTCTSTFKRASDLHRHAKVHQPGATKYECFVPGCPYRGARGFLRRDKLLSHQRNAHGLRY